MPFIVLGLFGLYTLEFGVIGIIPAITESFSVSTAQAGLMLGVFALAVAALGPPLVLLSSRVSRKTIIVISLLMFSLTSLGSALTSNFSALLVLRFIGGLFHPIFYAAALGTAMSLYPADQSAKAVSRAVTGTTLGMVIGIPTMSWISVILSWRYAFGFCAVVTLLAAISLMLMLPKSSTQRPIRFGEQLSILGLPQLWLSALTTVFIASGLFSVFSYAAQYLVQHIGVPLANVSLILMLFGVGGVAGNVLISRWLDQRLATTLLTQLIALAAVYLIILFLATPWLPAIGLIALCWGAAHAAGPVASQVWLRTSARRAPDFATSIYLTAANVGVVTGSTVSGWAIEQVGLNGAIGCGLVFIGLAIISVLGRISVYGHVGTPARVATPESQ